MRQKSDILERKSRFPTLFATRPLICCAICKESFYTENKYNLFHHKLSAEYFFIKQLFQKKTVFSEKTLKNCLDVFKRLQFTITASHCAAGIPLAYINNFIQIWCGVPFYSMLCRSSSRRMYLEPNWPLFESSARKYIWNILLHSNTNVSRSGFHRADYNLQ